MTARMRPVNGSLSRRRRFPPSGTIKAMLAPPRPYRFDEAEREVNRVLGEMSAEHGQKKQVAAATGIPYKKLVRALKRSEGREFLDIEELGLLAAYVSRHYRQTPLGWPIVTFEEHERQVELIRTGIEAAHAARRKT